MVQDYLHYTETTYTEHQTLYPNTKKIVLRNISLIIGGLSAIAFTLLTLHVTAGLDIFIELLEMIIDIETIQQIFRILTASAIITAVALIFISYLRSSTIRYECFENRIVAYKNTLYVLTETIEIPYENITRITYNQEGIFNTLFHSGTIRIETTGIEREELTLEFMDNIEALTQYIQGLVTNWKQTQQAQFSDNYAINAVLTKKR